MLHVTSYSNSKNPWSMYNARIASADYHFTKWRVSRCLRPIPMAAGEKSPFSGRSLYILGVHSQHSTLEVKSFWSGSRFLAYSIAKLDFVGEGREKGALRNEGGNGRNYSLMKETCRKLCRYVVVLLLDEEMFFWEDLQTFLEILDVLGSLLSISLILDSWLCIHCTVSSRLECKTSSLRLCLKDDTLRLLGLDCVIEIRHWVF